MNQPRNTRPDKHTKCICTHSRKAHYLGQGGCRKCKCIVFLMRPILSIHRKEVK